MTLDTADTLDSSLELRRCLGSVRMWDRNPPSKNDRILRLLVHSRLYCAMAADLRCCAVAAYLRLSLCRLQVR